MSTKLLENAFSLKDHLASDFYDGIKCPCRLKVGIEIEKISVLKNSFKAVPYDLVQKFLNIFADEYSWYKVKEGSNTLSLQKDGHSISLEPGSQIEISLAPMDNIHHINEFFVALNSQISKVTDSLGFYTLGYGIQPLSTYDEIDIIPKASYAAMTEYFADKGDMAYVMMRETAGTQVNLDYFSEDDAIAKLRLGMMLAPVVSAMFANSPIRGGQNTGYKTFRAKSWLYTDNDRCGFISEKLFDPYYTFTFDDYVDALLDLPMIFVVRDSKTYRMSSTFREYLATGLATLDDWHLHANLFFPEVRLKSFLEFRNADSQSHQMSLAIMAFYKGIFYDKEAMAKASEILSGVNMQILTKMRYLSPMCGLDVSVGEGKILDLALNLVGVAYESLQRQVRLNVSNCDESLFLLPLKNNLLLGKTPCDRLLEVCGDNIAKIVKYTKI
jgi:glutamate--cysteine ligase